MLLGNVMRISNYIPIEHIDLPMQGTFLLNIDEVLTGFMHD